MGGAWGVRGIVRFRAKGAKDDDAAKGREAQSHRWNLRPLGHRARHENGDTPQPRPEPFAVLRGIESSRSSRGNLRSRHRHRPRLYSGIVANAASISTIHCSAIDNR